MTIRVTRLHRQHYRSTVDVYLDGKLAARLAPGDSQDFKGSGKAQQLIVKSPGFIDSAPIEVTDPKRDRLLGVVVSYTVRRKVFRRGEKLLAAELMGPPTDYLPPEPI